MSRQDEIAEKAVRKTTLKSLKKKKLSRLKQLKIDYENAVQQIHIQYAEDPERLKAKYAAAEYAKNERAKKRAEKRIENEKRLLELAKKSRRLTLGEEIGSSIVQGFGVALFIAATAILDTLAVDQLKSFVNVTTVFYSLFGASMILIYLSSVLQHALANINAKLVFDRLSHVFSFLIIGFGYSAYTITKIQGNIGWILFGIVWGLVFTGILFYAIAGEKFGKVNVILYILAGFSGLFVAKNLFEVLSPKSFNMLVLGAAFYLLGIIFYNLKKIKFMHLLSNIIMLFGSVYIFFSLFFLGE
jgi:hemolysin III